MEQIIHFFQNYYEVFIGLSVVVAFIAFCVFAFMKLPQMIQDIADAFSLLNR